MRIELPDGQWAELRDRPTANQVNIVRRALLRAGEDQEAGADIYLAYVAAYCSAWQVTVDGNPVPLERAGDAPDDIVARVAYEASLIYKNRPDPKGSVPPSMS